LKQVLIKWKNTLENEVTWENLAYIVTFYLSQP